MDTPTKTRVHPAVALAIGAGSVVIGFLPWLITGMRLPLQNLWAEGTLPDAMPLALLPFSQYALTAIAGILIMSAVPAGLALRMLRPRAPRFGLLLALAVVLVLQVVAVAQTAAVVSGGLREDSRVRLYVAGLVALCVLAMAVGAACAALYAKAPAAGAIVASAFAGIALSWWVSSLFGVLGVWYAPDWVLPLLRWVAPVAIGAAIAWWGVASVGRAAAAVFALLMLWLVPGIVTGVVNAVSTRVLANDPAAMLDYGLGVMRQALFVPEFVLPPLAVAVAVAVVGSLIRIVVRRTRAHAPARSV